MSDATRILWWSDAYWPQIGGIEVLYSQLVPRLAARGFDITVVTNGVDGQASHDAFDGVAIRRLPFHSAIRNPGSGMRTEVLSDVAALKAETQPDIVHLTFPSPSSFFHLMTGNSGSARTICSIHTAFPQTQPSTDTLVRRMLVDSDHVTANSKATLRRALEAAPDIRDRASVIYNGISSVESAPSALSFDPPTILCIARLVEKKGLDVLLRALAIVRDTTPAARLVVAGDGPERHNLESLAGLLDIEDSVDWLGWVEPRDIPDVIDSATMLAVPSRTMEPFGIVAVEAMQMGRPVVCSDQGGLPEVVQHGTTGFVVPAGDATALANAILELLRNPPLAQRMGEAGILRARERFSIERCVDEHEALFREIVVRR